MVNKHFIFFLQGERLKSKPLYKLEKLFGHKNKELKIVISYSTVVNQKKEKINSNKHIYSWSLFNLSITINAVYKKKMIYNMQLHWP